MRLAIVGGVLLVLGALCVALGILSGGEAVALWERVWPILLFVVAITIVTELAARAGLFRVVAEATAAWGRGRAWALWLLVVATAVVSTVFLSLDTTAVLLTPVVIVLARHVGINPVPFALTTVWLANCASLLLPVSNLTNLLAQNALGDPSPLAFASLTWAPAIVAIALPTVAVFVIYRRQLVVRYVASSMTPIEDRVLVITSGAVVLALLPALVSGLAVWIPASCAAAILLVVFALRRRAALSLRLVPWQLVLFASGLFLVVAAAQQLGLANVLSVVSGSGNAFPNLLRFAGVAGAGSNLVNNLPAYLALEPVAHTSTRIVALLIGTNAGPLITPWASLATLLWYDRLRSAEVSFSWLRFAALGAIVAPVTVVAATLALSAVA